MKKSLFILICILLELFSNKAQAQIITVTPGTDFNVAEGTIVSLENLQLTPSADFNFSGVTLSKATSAINTNTIPAISAYYKFGDTTTAFSGEVLFTYLDEELNGLTESNLKLLYHNGSTWVFDNGGTNYPSANYVTATLTGKTLNEISLGTGMLQTYYVDTDNDGFGSNEAVQLYEPTPPAGYSVNNTDCDDADATKHTSFTFYIDSDQDTYGTGSLVSVCAVDATTPPAGYSVNNTDCNDTDATNHAVTTTTTVVTACDTYTWEENQTAYTTSGTYTVVSDCHTEVLTLTITPSDSNTTTASACDTYTWSVNAATYTASGTYTVVTGCHTEVLILSITPSSVHTTSIEACNSYDWNGQTYTASGLYSGTTTNCITEKLDLTIINNSITTELINSSICKAIGGTASFTVGTSATIATYKWYSQAPTATSWTVIANNSNYSGATTATLYITKTTLTLPATGTKYKVEITNPCGTITSNIATLTDFSVVSKAAAITAKSATNAALSPLLTTCQGNSVNLTLAAGSIGNIQWQSSTDGITYNNVGDSIAQSALSATNLAMPFNTGALTQSTWFRVVASNGVCNAANGTSIKITVSAPVTTGTISGGDITVCAPLAIGFDTSGNALTTAITNSTLLTLTDFTEGATILWQKSTNYTATTPIWSAAGSTTTTFTANALTADTWYRALVTNGACKDYTLPVKITVTKAAKAGAITSVASVCTGGDIMFTSAAYTGASIQWEVSTTSALTGFTPIADANQLTFTMNAVSYAPLSKFYVRNVVTSGNCTLARSAVKTITVNPLSVPGTVKGGGTICSGSNATLSVAGYKGTIQWQYSLDGVEFKTVPYWKTVAAVPTFFNPDNATSFSTSFSTGIAATYSATNITAATYFRAKITSGACSVAYSNAVQYTIGTAAVAGTLIAVNEIVCKGAGTTLTLTGSVGSIKWLKSTNWTATTPSWTAVTTSATGTLATGILSVATAYKAEVTIGLCSTATSQIIPVIVIAAPLAKTIIANVTSPSGASSTLAICTTSTSKVLTIGAGSVGAIQWQRSSTSSTSGFVDIADETATSYTVTNPTVGANYFRAKFTNSCGVSVFGTAFRVYYKECTPTKAVTSSEFAKTPFAVLSHPNPFTNNFNLDVTTSSLDKVEVLVYDMIGRLLEKHQENVSEINALEIGSSYPTGVYNVIVTQGMEVKTVRVIKK